MLKSKKLFSLIVVLVFLVITLIPVMTVNAASITVGAGSYTDILPSGATGPQSTVYKTSALTGAIPTNSWESSILWEQWSENLFAHPLRYKCLTAGLEVGVPVLAAGTDFVLGGANVDYTIVSSTTAPTDAKASKVTDWSVDIVLGGMTATIVKGSPFSYYTFTAGMPKLTFPVVPTVWSGNASSQFLGITVNGQNYGLFAPSGSAWSGIGTSVITCNLPSGKTYFSTALLPNNAAATLNDYSSRAFAFVTDTKVSWYYDEASSAVTTTYTLTTSAKEGTNTSTIMALYPHQWKNNSLITPLSYTYNTIRGTMKTISGTSFQQKLIYNGILPYLPDNGTYDRTTLNNLVNEFNSSTLIDSSDTYFLGKNLGRLANIYPIAVQTGNTTAAGNFMNTMKNTLTNWLTASPGETANLFYYDSNWGTLIGYPASFNSNDQLNDHHFHYGYFINAAARVAQNDRSWASTNQYGDMVNELIRDIANWDRTDTKYPFLRKYDPYEGHSWASGNNIFADGNNQESSSEAINAWQAIIQWGEATGNTTIRNLGIFLYTNEVNSINNYWFNLDGDLFMSGYGHNYASMVWGNKYCHEIWWADTNSAKHGINFLPFNAASVYLGKNPSYVLANYNEMLSECGGTVPNWQDIQYMYYALYNPTGAAANWNTSITPEGGETKAHTYHWIYNLIGMGLPDFSITANTAEYGVFNKNGTRTYVAYNPTSNAKTVTFSNGVTLSVAAYSLATSNGGSVPQVATPTFSPAGGTFTSAQNVTISCATAGVTIRYTIDGSEPTSSSIQYTGSIPVSATSTIKAKAFASGMTDSATVSATYTINITGVTFYQDINYGGTAVTLQPGRYTLAQLNAAGIPDNWMTSLKVPSGWTVEVYDGDNFTGTKWTYTADNSWIGTDANDKMTSVIISSTTTSPSTTWYLYNTSVNGVTPTGENMQTANSSVTGWQPTKTITTTANYWYAPAETKTYSEGTWTFTLWSNSPGGTSNVKVDLYKVSSSGDSATLIGSQTKDLSTTGSGNHPTTYAFSGIASQSLNDQRLLIVITKTSGTDATMCYNTNDFATRLVTP